MNKFYIAGLGAALFLAAAVGIQAQEEQQENAPRVDIQRLSIGRADLKNKTMDIVPGKILSAATGKEISFDRMIDEMRDVRYVYVGETHNSLPMHDLQFKVAEALYKQDRNLAIGLEMYDVTWQEKLNHWSQGLWTEDEFIHKAGWYVNWNFHFNYYKKIFDLAKDYKIPLYALNAPRPAIRKVRMMGWTALSDDEKAIIPEPDLTNEDHKTLLTAIFGQTEMPEAMKNMGDMMLQSLIRAQSAWDEVMAKYTRLAARAEGGRVMVLVGSGHLLYNIGINWRVYKKDPAPFKTVLCIAIPEGETQITVQRSLADYIMGIPEEEKPVYPSDGIALKKFDGLDNPVIERDPITGVAKGQDFKKGDVVLAVDGTSYTSINALRTYMSRFNWGDSVTFKLLREAKEITVTLKYEMSPEEAEEANLTVCFRM